MLRRILFLAILGLGHLNAQQNLSSFSQKIDDLTRQFELIIGKYQKIDEHSIQAITNYTLKSKNNSITLNIVEKTVSKKNEELLMKIEDFSYISKEVDVRFGSEIIAKTIQFELTKVGLEKIKITVAERERLEKLPATPEIIHKVRELRKESSEIVRKGMDVRLLADGEITYTSYDQSNLNMPTRRLEFGTNRFEASHLPSSHGLHLPMSRKEGRQADGRRRGGTALEMKEFGLIDSQRLFAVRSSLWGLPIDHWTLAGASTLESSVELIYGAILPPMVPTGRPTEIGKHVIVSSYSPDSAQNKSGRSLLDTFLIPNTYKSTVNPLNNYDRPATSNWVLSRNEMEMFPSAGLHENGRVFICGWVALASNQGLLVFVQYEDESRPRIAIFDPSGLTVKLDWGEVSYGCASVIEASTEKLKLVPQLSNQSHEFGLSRQEILHTTLDSNQTGSVLTLEGKEHIVHSQVNLVIPRSLW